MIFSPNLVKYYIQNYYTLTQFFVLFQEEILCLFLLTFSLYIFYLLYSTSSHVKLKRIYYFTYFKFPLSRYFSSQNLFQIHIRVTFPICFGVNNILDRVIFHYGQEIYPSTICMLKIQLKIIAFCVSSSYNMASYLLIFCLISLKMSEILHTFCFLKDEEVIYRRKNIAKKFKNFQDLKIFEPRMQNKKLNFIFQPRFTYSAFLLFSNIYQIHQLNQIKIYLCFQIVHLYCFLRSIFDYRTPDQGSPAKKNDIMTNCLGSN